MVYQYITTLKARAKANLYLYVTGKRADGKHNLNSLVVPLNLCDEIEVYTSDKLDIISDIENNNLWPVFHYFKAKYHQHDFNLRIVLNKAIPIAAGLGGSSTNAASIINFLNDYYNLNLSYTERCSIASQFGSDTAYFIDPKVAIMSEDGNKLEDTSLGKRVWILIVYPAFEVLSSECYKLGFSEYKSPVNDNWQNVLNGENQLSANAYILQPELKLFVQTMLSAEGCLAARVSGSGSSFFGLFNNEEDLIKAKEKFDGMWSHSELLEV